MKYIASLALLGAVVSAAPTKTSIEKRTSQCGQWDSQVTSTYTLYQDLWGISGYTGSQCSEINGLSGDSLSWDTTWSWSGGSSSVKSYANVVTDVNQVKLSTISSLASTWKWTYTGSDIVADVSYDIFTSATAGGANAYEIMIWVGALGGAGPISSTGSTIAKPTLAGTSWNLYSGPNGDTTVYSFVASSNVNSFSGDLMDFLNYISENQEDISSQYLVSIGAGTEPFTGSDAKLTTTAYSLVPSY